MPGSASYFEKHQPLHGRRRTNSAAADGVRNTRPRSRTSPSLVTIARGAAILGLQVRARRAPRRFRRARGLGRVVREAGRVVRDEGAEGAGEAQRERSR